MEELLKVIGVVVGGKYDWQKELINREVEIESINIKGKNGYGNEVRGIMNYHDCKRVRDIKLNNFTDEKISSKNIIMNIKEQFLLAITAEPQKSFRKAGVTNGDDLLTEDGQKVFLSWLLKKNADDFKKEVVDPILEDMEKDKK